MEKQIAELKQEIEELKIETMRQNLLLTLLPHVLSDKQRAEFGVLIEDFIAKSQTQLPESLVSLLETSLRFLKKDEQSPE